MTTSNWRGTELSSDSILRYSGDYRRDRQGRRMGLPGSKGCAVPILQESGLHGTDL